MGRLFLTLILTSFLGSSFAADDCILEKLNNLILSGPMTPQDQIWLLRSHGHEAEAIQVEKDIEKILRSKFSSARDIGEGAGGGRFYQFDKGITGVGKKAGRHWSSNVEAEVAAYRVDRLYDINLTPVTIAREAENGKVSMQLFYENAKQARLTKVKVLESDRKKLKIFDYLIDNFDRKDTNYLVNDDGRIIAIDHGVSFHNARSTPHSPRAPRLEELDLDFFKTAEGERVLAKLKTVSDDAIIKELSGILPEDGIQGFIKRKKQLLEKL